MTTLHINASQMQALDAKAGDFFLDRLTMHFQRELGISTPRSELRASIQVLVTRAERYGMAQQDAIAGFVALALHFGVFFDSEPQVRSVLTDQRIEPDERVDLLAELVPAEVWDKMPEFHVRVTDHLAQRESSA